MIKERVTLDRAVFDAVQPVAANPLFTNAEADRESARCIEEGLAMDLPTEAKYRSALARLKWAKRRRLRGR